MTILGNWTTKLLGNWRGSFYRGHIEQSSIELDMITVKHDIVDGECLMRRWLSKMVEWLGGHELAVLIGTFGLIVSTWAFLVLASEVTRGRTKTFDDRILLALRVPGDPSRPIGPEWLEEVARDVTALGSTVVLGLAIVAVGGFLALDRRYSDMKFVLGATLSGWILSSILKVAFNRPRPELVPHLMRVYFSSFPSGHSMMSAVVYGTLGALLSSLVTLRRLKFYFLTFAAIIAGLVGLSRVYLGVHYPTDVLAGWSGGVAWSTLCCLLSRRLNREGAIEPPV
jgi:undecaprenyl-diphosphatase